MKRHLFILIVARLFTSYNVFGQFEEIILPSDEKQQTIITEPPTLRKGNIRAGIVSNFIMIDREFNQDGKRVYVLGTNSYAKTWSLVPGIQYGISDRFQASVRLPYQNIRNFTSVKTSYPAFNFDTVLTYKNRGSGIGDIEVGFRYQLITESTNRPSVTLGFYGILPTGQKNPTHIKDDLNYALATGSGCTSLSADLFFKKVSYPYSITLSASYYYYFKGEKVMYPYENPIEFKKAGLFISSIGVGIHLNDWIALINDVNYSVFGENEYFYPITKTSDAGWVISYQPAIYFQIRKIRFFEIVEIPVAGRSYGADPFYSFSLQYIF